MFQAGERVRTKVMNPDGHTRLPLYLRGRPGRILNYAGTFPLSDARAGIKRDIAEALYTVEFKALDVWGSDADATSTIVADLFESYMEKRP